MPTPETANDAEPQPPRPLLYDDIGWFWWAAIVLTNVVVAVVSQVLWMFPDREPYLAGHYASIGLALGQASFAACWLVLKCDSLARRLAKSLVVVMASWLAFAGSLLCSKAGFQRPMVALSGTFAVIFGSFLLAQVALWVVRLMFGWRLSKTTLETTSNRRQFGIAGVLIATTAAAFFIFATKIAIQLTAKELDGEILGSFAIAIGCCLFVLLPMVARLMLGETSIAGGVGMLATTAVWPILFSGFLGLTLPLKIIACEVGFIFVLGLNLGAVRWAGFRLRI